ncbi:putative wall-associated receptor kinase-like 11 [Juglans regia]|uniref:Wall-associated receptor kinase-like 11 n=2 Tax=Juglans regia TaxID=51240 RepID=A0A6P9ETM0_JUGRE|nr:putative wall-associated receptor kinase-like 11 [Juglans regia]
MALQMLLFRMLVLVMCSVNAFAGASNVISSSCPQDCGNNVSIPYPFGIGKDCYVGDWFEIVCRNDSYNDPGFPKVPFLKRFDLEVLKINIVAGTVRVSYPIFSSCTNVPNSTNNLKLEKSPFAFSANENSFVGMGCSNSASLRIQSLRDDTLSFSGCTTPCDRDPFTNGSSCNATNCCQITIRFNLQAFNTTIEPKSSEYCNYAFLVDQNWFENNFTELSELSTNPNMSVPVVLDWGIDNTSFYSLPIRKNSTALEYKNSTYSCYTLGYPTLGNGTQNLTNRCWCRSGYRGNPYLLGGCEGVKYIGVSASLGVLFLIFGGWWSYKVIKKKMRIKRKEKFFKRNGGLLLEQLLSTNNKDKVENTKLFNSKELEKATDRFSADRIIGHGGQGTVYKGMLADGRIVAIKKSNVIDEVKLQEFVNEVVILSQINHRNVVKLLGCCLEIEVPLLVYEFIPNGTLAQYLNGQNEEFPPTWDMRLRIAIEVAGALFYLHSVASSPIYHRDIKSTNILLDDKYRAKVADFGISRSVAIDQTHLSTLVLGTFGYVDPEYFWSGQFTDKSDVYSFGVVLVELLTGENAISSSRTRDIKSLAAFFVSSMEGNNLFDILDNRVLNEVEKEKIIAVANLAKRCLNLNGKDRPSMREVARELEANQMSPKVSNLQEKYGEIEDVGTKISKECDVVSISTTSGMDGIFATSSSDSQPFLVSS